MYHSIFALRDRLKINLWSPSFRICQFRLYLQEHMRIASVC